MMKNTPLRILVLYVFVSLLIVSHTVQVVAGDNSGFISIDCGAHTDYMDEETGIWYQTDEAFIGSGNNHELPADVGLDNDYITPPIERQLMTLRSFPKGERNCYTLKPKQEKKEKQKYLIRAVFAYENYDLKNQVPIFDLYLGVNYWDTVGMNFYFSEIIQQVPTEMVQVCLANKGQGTPFINTLELRPLNHSLYSAPLPLIRRSRLHFSGLRPSFTRYKDDVYDRLWGIAGINWWYQSNASLLETSVQVRPEDSAYELPSEIFRTASQALNYSKPLTVEYPRMDTYQYQPYHYLFLHFAEIQQLPSGHKRIINVTFSNENSLFQEVTLEYLKPVTLCSDKITKGYINFTIAAGANSDAPPILNALEIYQLVPQPNSPTNTQDVNAIMEIKHTYGISKISWQGDPCVPDNFTWDGLNCSSGNNMHILSLNLSSSKLTGQIDSSFTFLEKLESLDLSNNELTGQLPEFLATLPNLKLLNVTGNKLTGSIPKALREKANLQLSVANNPGLCQTNSCNEHKSEIPLIASVVALVIVIVIVALVIWRFRKKRVLSTKSLKKKVLRQKNQSFSYSEVLHITNNFKTTIGEGGFGKVYLGTLKDDTKVAVKLLSPSSMQGYKEFQSEAQLLTVIHHRNLVSLVGYCDEKDTKALIYEYMDYGDLSRLLSGTLLRDKFMSIEKNSNVFKWNERLQVAVDAAKGLEYLHNGCETPIIHRDLKPSNILLNKSMVAKIADFGLSKVFINERDSHLSTQPAGTPGYIDPEFQKSGNLNKKSDIYSFGIILLQLITGHPPMRRELGNICFITDWIRPKIECGDIQVLVDPRLTGEFHVASAWKAVEIAMSCTLPESKQRPDISYVLHELMECLAMEMDHAKSNSIPSNPISYSGQSDSMTTLSPR